jgi:transposase
MQFRPPLPLEVRGVRPVQRPPRSDRDCPLDTARDRCLDGVSLLSGGMTEFAVMTANLVEELVPDQLWQLVVPLLPTPPRPPYGGRRRTVSDRSCLAAMVFMARTSTPWRLLPARELGCGSPATVWRRLDEWARAGVFDALHLEVLDRLGVAGRLDWSRASVDTMSVRAKHGGTMWAQILSTAASQDPSSTLSPTAKASPLPSR